MKIAFYSVQQTSRHIGRHKFSTNNCVGSTALIETTTRTYNIFFLNIPHAMHTTTGFNFIYNMYLPILEYTVENTFFFLIKNIYRKCKA